MDDAMIDLMARDAELGRRLLAFAETRLTPELAATSRMRARVLAVAHRQADLARADSALAVLTRPVGVVGEEDGVTPAHLRAARRATWRRTAAVLLAASLALSAMTGTALAARPGGPLYAARVWVETLALPSEPTSRVLAQLDRLEARLAEAAVASAAGDADGANAALAAYAAIVKEASSNGELLDDAVASAALEAGVARNLEVLQALADRLPAAAAAGIQRAIDNAIEHSGKAIDSINGQGPNGNGAGPDGDKGVGVPGQPGHSPKPEPTDQPKPTAKPEPTAKSEPTDKPEATPKPPKATPEPTAAPTAEPERTPRPGRTPPAGSHPGNGPGDQGPPATPPRGGKGGG
jgi:hypothetical protein